MGKFTEPTADGSKHYVVTIHDWDRDYDQIVRAINPTEARWAALPRAGVGQYIVKVRRATLADMEG